MQEHEVPATLRSLSTLENPDYADCFTATTSSVPPRSPEQWARALIEGAVGLRGQFVWRVVLRLRLAPLGSPEHVGGWEIADRGDSWIRLGAASRFLTAELVVHADDGYVSVSTFLRYERPPAAAIWTPVGMGHRRVMPRLLRRAVKLSARSPG